MTLILVFNHVKSANLLFALWAAGMNMTKHDLKFGIEVGVVLGVYLEIILGAQP
jgi:hypothetical protein